MLTLVLSTDKVIKIRENGKVVDKRKRIVFGSLKIEDIGTTDVENFNSILRERVGRHDNLTPAMIESLSDNVWNWDDFLLFHYAV